MSDPNKPTAPTGINLSDWSIRHRALVLFFMLVIAVAGIRSYFNLGRNEDPPFTVKTMVIEAMLPGASVEETTHQLTDRIEKSFRKRRILTTSKVIRLQARPPFLSTFWAARPRRRLRAYGTRSAKGGRHKTLPTLYHRWPLFDDEFGDTYGIIYAFTADGFSHRELRDYVETVRDELLRVPDVAKIDTLGAQDEKIYVDFSTHHLSRLGINGVMIAAALQAQNALVPSGTMDTGKEQILVQPTGRFNTVDDVARVTVYAGGKKSGWAILPPLPAPIQTHRKPGSV